MLKKTFNILASLAAMEITLVATPFLPAYLLRTQFLLPHKPQKIKSEAPKLALRAGGKELQGFVSLVSTRQDLACDERGVHSSLVYPEVVLQHLPGLAEKFISQQILDTHSAAHRVSNTLLKFETNRISGFIGGGRSCNRSFATKHSLT